MNTLTWMKVFYMENNNFIKYIIKKIVRVIYVKDHLDISHPYSDWYRIEKVSIDDCFIKDILDEGKRYGLSAKKCQSYISQADRMINFSPSITEIRSSFDVCSMPNGTHVRFIYENSSFGSLAIDAIKDGKHNFFVLKSDVAALCWDDNLVFTVNKLQCGTYPAFCVYRNNQTSLAVVNYFCPGKLVQINVYSPGITHEIIDTKTDFRKDGKRKIQESEMTSVPIAKIQSIKSSKKKNSDTHAQKDVTEYSEVHYLWPPSRWNPIAFCFTDMDNILKSPDHPPFIATIHSVDFAEFTVNPQFIETLQSVGEKRTASFLYLLEAVMKTCKVQKQSVAPNLATKLNVISKGTLSLSPSGKNIWIMEKAPIISLE